MNAEDFDRAFLWRFRATKARVIDGDTVAVLCDTGYRGRHEARLRLAGIDAPEMGTGAGALARLWLDKELDRAWVWTKTWELRVETIQRETVVSETTSFERWVSRLWMVSPDDGSLIDVAEAMVAAGHATPVAP